MIESEIIIVGGGPAGSACAWQLKQHGREVLVLDKAVFPRLKLCAGWITPEVLTRLQITPESYPHSILMFTKLHFYFYGRHLPVRTRQYSIRRFEFDDWMLQRSAANVERHRVKDIKQQGEEFIIDDRFRCRYLVGAGGTGDPVYHRFFREKQPRIPEKQISTIEEEFEYEYKDANCYLWFFENGLPGYAWYVPKGNGYLNVGIGGKSMEMKRRGKTIRDYWQPFTDKLEKLNLVTGHNFESKGFTYYLRNKMTKIRSGNTFIIGDAAGMATVDMGEGIGPAVESGLQVAQAIINENPLRLERISRFSVRNIIFSR